MKCEYCEIKNTCDTCQLPKLECLMQFEVSAYGYKWNEFIHLSDKTFNNLNEATTWAIKEHDADMIEVYQGCDRENKILSMNLP